jgi:DNA invertase Pin-like site-specific DNA recombinase
MQVERVIAYCRVSTDEQARNGSSLAGQREAIASECKRRGWNLMRTVEDAGYSGKSLRRPGIQAALRELESGHADGLVVAKLDRLSRSMRDFTALLERARKEGWALTALDADVDTSTAAGEAMAHVIATFARFESRRIGERTAEGIARRRQRRPKEPWGRRPEVPAEVVRRIRRQRKAGWSLSKIADRLTEEQVPTAHGGKRWYPSTVRAVLQRAERSRSRAS